VRAVGIFARAAAGRARPRTEKARVMIRDGPAEGSTSSMDAPADRGRGMFSRRSTPDAGWEQEGGWLLRPSSATSPTPSGRRASIWRRSPTAGAILAAVPDLIMEVATASLTPWANPAGLAFFGDDVVGKGGGLLFFRRADHAMRQFNTAVRR